MAENKQLVALSLGDPGAYRVDMVAGMSTVAAEALAKRADADVKVAEATHAVPAKESRKLGQSALASLLVLAGMATWKLTGESLAWVLAACAISIGGYLTAKAAIESKAKHAAKALIPTE